MIIQKPPKKMHLVTADQMRTLDRLATEKYGIPSILLMENAGRAVKEVAGQMLGDLRGRRILVICGPGNNGGDGFVAARHLLNAGAEVRISYFGDKSRAKGDALVNLEIAEKMGLDIDFSGNLRRLKTSLGWAELVIDALLGTGIKGEVGGDFAKAIELVNSFQTGQVLAVDIPSGVDADTGRCWGPKPLAEAVMADCTVTFGLPKIGLVTYPGAAYVGKLIVADISIPGEELEDCDSKTFLLDSNAVYWPPCRYAGSHKGDYGHLAIIAGSVGMTGAATLAAEGALRIGTGLVTVAVPESLNDILEVKLTEAMTIPVTENSSRAFGTRSLDQVLEVIEKRDAAVIGPGLGRNEDTVAFVLDLVKRLRKPAVIDADGLFALSNDLSILKTVEVPIVMTPHPGEMATLLGTSVSEVQSNRLEVALAFARDYGVTVVLKGAGTIIADVSGRAYINTTGTPGMATGGVGDVLAGMIGGLLAQGWTAERAACTAVYIHGRAGEIAAEECTEPSMIASDVAERVGDAIDELIRISTDKIDRRAKA
jgi:hydroxyethylthiazole kinase-like uncharacterized protein yjeF